MKLLKYLGVVAVLGLTACTPTQMHALERQVNINNAMKKYAPICAQRGMGPKVDIATDQYGESSISVECVPPGTITTTNGSDGKCHEDDPCWRG